MSAAVLNRNILLLIVAQALGASATIAMVSFAPLVGELLTPNPLLATVPITFMVSGAALSTGMLSLFMARYGRRMGFRLGAMLGLLGAAVCVYAIDSRQFSLFCAGALLFGVFQGSLQYLRFAASETVQPAAAAKAISFVLLGSVIGAFLVPLISKSFLSLFDPELKIGVYIYLIIATGLLQIPYALMGRTHSGVKQPQCPLPDSEARPLSAIFSHKAIWAAVINCCFGYAMMSFVMTATPLAMKGCGLSISTSTQVISFHAIAMFLPGLITGSLIGRFGLFAVITCGHLLYALAFIIALMGIEEWHFTVALILLGVGWNFTFIGGSTLLTKTYRVSEAGKVQGLNETLVVSLMALASLGAGFILSLYGWQTVNQIAFVMLLVAASLTNLFRRQIDAAQAAND